MVNTGAEVLQPSIKQALDNTTNEMVAIADAYVIDSNEMADLAADELKKIKAEYKRVEGMRLDITRPLDAAKKAAMAAFKPYLEKLDRADSILRKSISGWMVAESARVARERAAAERAAAEEQAKIDAARKAAEAAFDAATEAGDEEAAQEALRAAEEAAEAEETNAIAPLQNVAEAQKMSGISGRKHYKVDKIDLLELVQSAAENPELLDFLQANTVEIGKLVRARGMKHGIPGVTAIETNIISVRS